ncbi:hypothetical protein DPMN_105691 [Dreissena polymorpha]|uniref:Uncharacterized protein n=1 Tax=Dreissena polymorpha TaxID=45954 RepID=A0A9D4K3L9_DREPO|nr:hypothetical protein DPMN_105691 [Dreissena polymorpha]
MATTPTGVISQQSNVLPGTGMLSMPINLGPGLVPQGLKSAGQIRGSTHLPLQLQVCCPLKLSPSF